MRVCMITPRYSPDRCGVGDYTELLARHLVERGVDVAVITSSDLALRRQQWTEVSGARVQPLIDDWGWASLPRLCSIGASGRFDVVHVQYQNEMYGRSAAIAALPIALRAVRSRLPVVVTVHDYGTPWPRGVRVRAIAGPYGKLWFAAMLLASARVVLTNEQDEWRFLHQRWRYPIPSTRYTTIPIGSNLPTAPAPAGSAGGTSLSIGYFGFVNPAKGVDTLLDGFALALRRRPGLRLTMICALQPTDPYHRIVLHKLAETPLRETVSVTGELEDEAAAATLARCDMVVLPYRDGISLRRTTLMAALALGRPVISTRAAVLPTAVRDGRDVILVPPSDPEALAQAIVDLAGDEAGRERLGASARIAARAFGWPAIAERAEQIYRQVLG